MDRGSSGPGGFRKPLGRASSGCRECNRRNMRAQQHEDEADDRRLSGSGTTCDDQHLVLQRRFHGFALHRVEPDFLPLFLFCNQRGRVRKIRETFAAEDTREVLGDALLGVVELRAGEQGWLLVALLRLHRLDQTIPSQLLKRSGDHVRIDAQLGGGLLGEFWFWIAGVTVERLLIEHVEQACHRPFWRIFVKAHAPGDAVCLEKTDACNLGEPIGIVLNRGDAAEAVLVMNLLRITCRNAQPVQEAHDLAQFALLAPTGGQAAVLFAIEDFAAQQCLRVAVNDLEGVLSEFCDNLLRRRRADVLESSGGKVALHALKRGGLDGHEFRNLELPPVGRMIVPAAFELQGFVIPDVEDRALDRDCGLGVVYQEAANQEAGLRLGIDDALEGSSERDLVVGHASCCTDAPEVSAGSGRSRGSGSFAAGQDAKRCLPKSAGMTVCVENANRSSSCAGRVRSR